MHPLTAGPGWMRTHTAERLGQPATHQTTLARRLTLGSRDLSGLDQLLEAAEILPDLAKGVWPQPLDEAGTNAAPRGLVVHADLYQSAPLAGRGLEDNRARVLEWRTGKRTPLDPLTGHFGGQLGVPLQLTLARQRDDPARPPFIQRSDGNDSRREAGEVRDIPPECIALRGRLVDEKAALQINIGCTGPGALEAGSLHGSTQIESRDRRHDA